jgi:hypothetical protein
LDLVAAKDVAVDSTYVTAEKLAECGLGIGIGLREDVEARHAEMKRRERVFETYKKNTASSSSSVVPIEFASMDLSHVLAEIPYNRVAFHVGHLQQKLRAKYATVRIVALFPKTSESSSSAVTLFTEELKREGGAAQQCDTHVAPIGQFFLLAKSRERMFDPTYGRAKVARLMSLHESMRRDADAEFRANVSEKKTGSIGRGVFALLKKGRELRGERKSKTVGTAAATLASDNDKKKGSLSESFVRRTRKMQECRTRQKALKTLFERKTRAAKEEDFARQWPRSLEQRGQTFAVISILEDITPEAIQGKDDSEPAVCVWTAADTADECTAFCKGIGKTIPFNLDVVHMYEFLFPQEVDMDNVQEVYRDEELNNIMSARKTEAKAIALLSKEDPDFPLVDENTPIEMPPPDRVISETNENEDEEKSSIREILDVTKEM